MGDVVKFRKAPQPSSASDGLVKDTMICADWAFGGVIELLRRMSDDELETIYVIAYGVFEETPEDVINAENEALITLIECERDRRGWDDGDVA